MTSHLPIATRRLLHLIALLCLAAVGVALVSQHVFDMAPCAWCVFQRLIYIGIALVCWLGLALGRIRPVLARIAAGAAAVLAAGGALAAWYQYDVAAQMFSCAQTFADQFMVRSGLDAGLPWIFGIYATCMDAQVALLGIEYALWSLALFVLLALLGLAAAFSGRR
ncbi:disulfide bond formation protein B [Pusillimonas caeni]|uniref:disulfide bond formation protein B n=1 Tax=Pusillimonas caeni TaxID=1348472 RepID=UPI000E59D177|nr:disulfide bond formation protein B [Pusillimonas caeni]TFL11178.1 disulfide bond formation protein B [Pusillimonas caeni]